MPQAKLISPAIKQTRPRERVAAYCRVSSNSADQLNSYATQINVYTRLINNNPKWELVDIFADEGISGTSADKRSEFLRMIRQCESKQIDLIITKSVSRFARNVKEALEYVRKLKLLGIGVQFEKEGINTLSLGDEMLLNTFAAIAQEESKAISQHMRSSIVKRMETGEYVASSAPFGYRLNNKILEIYEPEAKVVRRIFNEYLNGCSTPEIARELSAEGFLTKAGKNNWKSVNIAYILSNEKYIGDSKFQKTYRDTMVPFKAYKNRGQMDMFYAEKTHEPIVDKETFNAVQDLLLKRREQFAKLDKKYQRHALTSRIQCSECGSYYRRKPKNDSVKWVCSRHYENSKMCPSNYYSEERIYDGFITIINKLRFSENDILGKTISKLEYATAMQKKNNTAAHNISEKIAKYNSKLVMLEQLHSKGYLPIEVYRSQAHEIQNELSKLKAERQDAFDSHILCMLEEVKKLKALIDEIEEPLEEFDDKLFETTVKGLTIDKNDYMTVTFISGLKFIERI